MRIFRSFVVLGIVLLHVSSCRDNSKTQSGKFPTSYKLDGTDTINFTDNNGLKQGRWIVFYNATSKSDSLNQKLISEDGIYKDNKKHGLWKYYNLDGSLKNSIEYKDDAPASK